MQNEKRPLFDWMIFALIHIVVIGAISVVAFYVYGTYLAIWVAASATVAGLASTYLFAKDIPGETTMKCCLYIIVAANAGYLAHNGAGKIGVESYNGIQVEKFNKAMEEAGKAATWRIARELRLGAENASHLKAAFSDGVSFWVALLAFFELGLALIIFSIGSHRGNIKTVEAVETAKPATSWVPTDLDVKPTRTLEGIDAGKDQRR